MINFILAGAFFKNKLCIGKSDKLLAHLPQDLQYFKTITTSVFSNHSVIKPNVVVMGHKTWLSIPKTCQPLSERINIVLTYDKKLQKKLPKLQDIKIDQVYYTSFKQFVEFYTDYNPSVYVIGGAQIYNLFLIVEKTKPNRIYLTEINIDKEFLIHDEVLVNLFDNEYRLVYTSEKQYHDVISFRYLLYKREKKEDQRNEDKYIDLCQKVMKNGEKKTDRTSVGTLSTFGQQVHFDISMTIPLLTTKYVPWKHIIEELLWFIRGDTDTKILNKKGVKIWDNNTSREFLDSRGLYKYNTGILGKGYGWQWRFFGANYHQLFADTAMIDRKSIGGFDQLQYILDELQTNPFSRRILMCYWNPLDLKETALPPCHYSCQFYVHTNKVIDCHFVMRSTDCGLGLPFNIVSYAILTYIIAAKCGLRPGTLIYTGGDVHVYRSHLIRLQQQFERTPRPEPCLLVNPNIKDKKLEDITIADFDLVGYFPHPSIKMTMAV